MSSWYYPKTRPDKDRDVVLYIKEADGTSYQLKGMFKKSAKNQCLFHSFVNGHFIVDNLAWKKATLWRYLEAYERLVPDAIHDTGI